MIIIITTIQHVGDGIRISANGRNIGETSKEEVIVANAMAVAIREGEEKIMKDNPDIFSERQVDRPFTIGTTINTEEEK